MARLVLVRRVPQLPPDRDDNDRQRQSEASQQDTAHDDRLLVGEAPDPALGESVVENGDVGGGAAEDEGDVTVETHCLEEGGERGWTGGGEVS